MALPGSDGQLDEVTVTKGDTMNTAFQTMQRSLRMYLQYKKAGSCYTDRCEVMKRRFFAAFEEVLLNG